MIDPHGGTSGGFSTTRPEASPRAVMWSSGASRRGLLLNLKREESDNRQPLQAEWTAQNSCCLWGRQVDIIASL